MSDKVPEYDITIKAGADYAIDFDYTDDDEISVDVSGWTVEAQARESAERPNAMDFECSADEDGYHLSMAAEKTAQLHYAKGVYDVFIEDPDGIRSKLIEGHVTVIPQVTR